MWARCMDRDKYVIDGKICMDFFIRYENLEAGLMEVCDRLHVPFDISKVPRLKVSNRDHKIRIADFYGPDAFDIVEKSFCVGAR